VFSVCSAGSAGPAAAGFRVVRVFRGASTPTARHLRLSATSAVKIPAGTAHGPHGRHGRAQRANLDPGGTTKYTKHTKPGLEERLISPLLPVSVSVCSCAPWGCRCRFSCHSCLSWCHNSDRLGICAYPRHLRLKFRQELPTKHTDHTEGTEDPISRSRGTTKAGREELLIRTPLTLSGFPCSPCVPWALPLPVFGSFVFFVVPQLRRLGIRVYPRDPW
jgi:hypothetical protein